MRNRTQSRTYTLKIEKQLLGKMEADILNRQIQQLIRKGVKYLTMDLSRVRLINGPGIKFLLNTRLQIEKMNGSFQVKNPSKNIKQILEMVYLRSVSEHKRLSTDKPGTKGPISKTINSLDSSKLTLSSKAIAFI